MSTVLSPDDAKMITGADIEAERLRQRLGDPETVAALNHLLDNAELVAGLLDVVGGFFAHSDNIVENVATSYHEAVAMVTESPVGKRAVAAGPALLKVADQAIPVLEHVADADLVEKIGSSGLLDPALLDLLTRVAGGVSRATEQAQAEAEQKPPSIIAISGMTRDPDVRRGLAFALRIVKELGRSLREEGEATATEGEQA
ncbi:MULTISPECIES: DUF1641 domain-containing protein [Microbacterium]|uniref:DUF1641 domain-containing protein n=1 Tax=Microbacterium schleiferi TaxID=69362 RepID=A0ABU7V7E6_9MICO|nr:MULTISPECIES: DUF1641 domain-containing protein [unclassified Microbacterium]OJV97238.1 MAG: hypothetical protein BGO47_10250 [Microbacterium sp. 67-17]